MVVCSCKCFDSAHLVSLLPTPLFTFLGYSQNLSLFFKKTVAGSRLFELTRLAVLAPGHMLKCVALKSCT